MRRAYIATLLILFIAWTPTFSEPIADCFSVETEISLIGYMKVSSSAIGGHTLTAYNNSGEFTTLGINSSGDQNFSAYVTTLCNCRTGYEVTMTATAMTSGEEGETTSYINYTVGCNNKSITTNGSAIIPPVRIVNKNQLIQLRGLSKAISLSVDETTFDAAVAGEYTGTVTFTFSAT